MRKTLLILGASALLLLGCGGSGDSSSAAAGAGGSGTTATGAGGASTASASSTGAGGAGGGSTSATSSSSATSTGAGGGGPCADGFIDVDGDGATKHLASPCASGWAFGAKSGSGRIGYSGPGGAQILQLEACAGPGAMDYPFFSAGVPQTSAGQTTDGEIDYTTTGPAQYTSGNAIVVNVTAFGPVGDHITGDFTTTVIVLGAGQSKMLTGKFSVCREADMPPPP